MKRFAVIGNPIGHSKSPMIHMLFAEQLGHKISYEALLAPVDGFEEFLGKQIEAGLDGANVTLPFKEQAYELSDELTDRAKLAGAVNTLSFAGNKIKADNTDGQGLVEDLIRLKDDLKGKRILLLGAGGAAKGVVKPLFDAGVNNIVISNRTYTKAEALATSFAKYGDINSIEESALDDIEPDIVVNSTSSSVHGALPNIPDSAFGKCELAYDMYYSDAPTAFMQHAKKVNNKIDCADGLGMLVGQAAESYFIWTGKKPEIAPVLNSLRS